MGNRLARALVLIGVLAVPTIAGGYESPELLTDAFDGSTLNTCDWQDISRGGVIRQQGELLATTDGTRSFSSAQVITQYRLAGDFDVQVDYRLGDGWSLPLPSGDRNAHLDVALAIFFDGSRYALIARRKDINGERAAIYTNVAGLDGHNAVSVALLDSVGSLRVSRSGTAVVFSFSSGAQWRQLDSMNLFAEPASIYLAASNVSAQVQYAASFDNFAANGQRTSRPISAEPLFRSRPDFIVGGAVSDYLAQMLWAGYWRVSPLDFLKPNGIEWARVWVTTVSSATLRNAPVSLWHQAPFREEFWSSREYSEEILREAAARGYRLNLVYFLSNTAAHAGVQDAPPEWKGLSVDETAAALETYSFETTKYFVDRQIPIELYDIGNEVDFGILNFRPNERIPLPPGVDIATDMNFMKTNVWNLEARLLKGAIRGVRRANPRAKIVLHIAGLLESPGNVFARSFFETMVAEGVDFDYAGLSIPYAIYDWSLDQYTTECWFQRLQELIDSAAVLGKKVIFCEGDYPWQAFQGTNGKPMRDFPFTPDGQAQWVQQHLRFFSNEENIAGFFYWYPDYFPGITGAPANVQYSGLFVGDSQPALALSSFRVNRYKVNATADKSEGPAPLTVNFASNPSGGTSYSYQWDFGDGGKSTARAPVHVYATPGTYVWKVTLTADGTSVFSQGTLRVTPARRRVVHGR